MTIRVLFHSYFKGLTGCSETAVEVADATTLEKLVQHLQETYPKLKPMQRSTLMAVGVEYQPADYELRDGDEVSLFPPVQGG